MPSVSLAEMTQQRRSAVLALSATGKKPAEIAASLQALGFVNAKTNKPYSRQTIRADIREAVKPKVIQSSDRSNPRYDTRPLSETIGQWTYNKPNWSARVLLNMDTTWIDVIFWDAVRRGTAAGFEISGPAFCLPAAQTIASYVFGKGINASLVESAVPASIKRSLQEAALVRRDLSEENGKPTQNKRNALNTGGKNPAQQGKTALQVLPKPKPEPTPGNTDPAAWTNLQIRHMLERNQGFFLSMLVDDYCLGNQYVICNPDCTFSIASPETVTVDYSASDYRRVLRVIIRTKMQQATVEDVYTEDKRTLTVNYYDERGTQTFEYENLIGRIPIVHFANDRSANEIYGRPIYQAGLPIMWRYDQLINNILEGVALLGTPIPMFFGLDNVTETKKANSTAVPYTDDLGNTQTEYVTRLDRQTGIWLGKGGDGKMLSTNVGFTKDSLDALRQLFLLWLNETHIPELIWGGAISSSKASAETQMPPFIKYIEFRRLMLEGMGADPALGIDARGGILELIDIWLKSYKLLNPNIVVGPVKIDWPEIDVMGDQMKYMWGTFLAGAGYITPETALKMSGYVDDPAAEVMKAAGKKPRVPKYDSYDEALRKSRLEAARASLQPPDDNGPPFATDWVTPNFDQASDDMDASESGVGGVNSVAAHQHAEGDAMGNPWNPFGPLFWIDEISGRGGG